MIFESVTTTKLSGNGYLVFVYGFSVYIFFLCLFCLVINFLKKGENDIDLNKVFFIILQMKNIYK